MPRTIVAERWLSNGWANRAVKESVNLRGWGIWLSVQKARVGIRGILGCRPGAMSVS